MSLARTTLLNRRSRDPVLFWVTRTVCLIVMGLAMTRRSRIAAENLKA